MTTLGSPQFSISSLKTGTTLSDLIHRAGHDIGNPLTSLISLASLIERSQRDSALKLDPQSLEKYSSTIISDAWRVQGISEKLVLIFSDRGSGSEQVEVVPIVQGCIKRILRKPFFQSCDILFSPPAQPLKSAVDPSQLEWLAGELLHNSLTHLRSVQIAGAPQGAVRMNGQAEDDSRDDAQSASLALCAGAGGTIVLTVENDLHEVPAVGLDTLFEPFVRFPAQGRGAGLGLTAAWAVVERAGGKISIEAGDGRFKTTVELPSNS